ncbi:hypothetical protein, partial [Aquimarina litoralis]|uniref:hypothetical protein n=1 Tax=Aquimarina litoralis TaxID=584605 RepID=UPI001C594E58
MKKRNLLTTLFVLLVVSFVKSQVIYSDNFDQGILTVESSNSYSSSLSGGNLIIEGDGTAGGFDPIVYTLHNSGTETSINISSSIKVYIKVSGTSNPELRVDIQDEDSFVTNLSPQSVRIDSGSTIYELDYTSSLQDGGYGG